MSREAEGEIAAIVARLKSELRRGTGGPDGEFGTFRAQAERAWAVTAERPFEQPPTRRGRVQAYLFVPVKRLLRKLMRWYVEPLAAQQRTFNLAIFNYVDELERRIESLERRPGGGDEPGG
jgi:hypothetical protein